MKNIVCHNHVKYFTLLCLFKGTYSNEYPSSPRDSFNNMNKSSGGGNRYPLGNYNMDSCPIGDSGGAYSSSSTNNSTSQYDSANCPAIRETGIIEKLLVRCSP